MSVCVYYVLRPTVDLDRRRLADWGRPPTLMEWSIEREADGPALSLHACDLVREWERASGWKLPEKHRVALHADLSVLLQELAGPLELTATWIGDPINSDVEASRLDLLERVLANRVANRTRYRISAQERRSPSATG